jgi:4-hydroxy-2-oxoheptanedioate aldolase
VTHQSLTRPWDDGRAAIGGWVSRGHDFTIDMFRRAGYDFVGIDCQHTPVDESTVAAMLAHTPAGSPATLVRVSKNDATLIGLLADAGADGVIVPMVSTVDEAAAAVAAVHYPPRGIRSYGPMRPDLPMRDLQAMAARVSIFVMIETEEGLANVEEIAAVPGVAGIYVGPSDLSIALGLDPALGFESDQLVEPVERIRQACEKSGVVLAMHQVRADDAVRWIERGVRLVSISDRFMLFAAAVAELERAREATPPGPGTPRG